MKVCKQESNSYEPPRIETIDIARENGFEFSYLKYDSNPSMDYGDDDEQWF